MVVAKRDPRVVVASQYVQEKRRGRSPQHKFALKMLPYEIQPFAIAPVLPGESVKSCMLQAQCWSDPLATGLKNLGWWLQFNLFYVRHRDLPEAQRAVLANMLLVPGTDVSALQAGAQSYPYYTFDGGIKWSELLLQHVVSEYFRDEGEDYNVATGPSGLPMAKIYGRGSSDGSDKLTLESDYEDRRVDLIQAGHLYADQMGPAFQHWQALQDAGLTQMDYQDFMRTYGSAVREDENSPNLHRAEDLWSHREFTYPTNTVEPTTGVPAVAVGWRVQKNGGKRIFCDEPGFIFGVTYARPKVYLRKQKGSLAGIMQHVNAWLPAVLNDQRDLGHILHDGDEGPFPGIFSNPADPEGYWLDVRDLLLYGDQYVNYDPATDPAFLDLPDVNANRRYAASAAIAKFFKTQDGSARFLMDGLLSLDILGRQAPSQSGKVLGMS